MAHDMAYDQYEEVIRKMASDLPRDFAGAPAGAYRRDAGGGFAPEPRPGCTVLAGPYPITSIKTEMALLQNQLRGQCPEFAGVPTGTLHMTVADLKAGKEYLGLAADERVELCAEAARILDGHRFPHNTAGTIAGIGVFPSVVIALISFSPAAYQAVMAARDAIHTGLGLCPQFPFVGHITLGYVEIPADARATQRARAKKAVASARQAFARSTASTSVTFPSTGR
jgi:2'-5' RNA ligase